MTTRLRRALELPRDARLRVSVVIMGLQVLGQVGLGFKVSIAQIVVSIGTAVALEAGITFFRERRVAWPASALLTGNGTALILRTAGTRHGDWWSFNGIQIFVLAAALGILSKYVIRVRGRHVYNPSNLGLVACFVIAGPFAVFPQYLWWGDLSISLVAAYVLIVGGALWVLLPLRMERLALAFLAVFLPGMALLAATGHCFVAIWSAFPVCGGDYWASVALSPEVLVFVFFMISDPRTVPVGSRGRVIHGALTATIALAFIAFQPTEYGVKLGLLAALTLACAAYSVSSNVRSRRAAPAWDWGGHPPPLIAPALLVVLVATLVTFTSLFDLAGNPQIRLVEEGKPPAGVPSQG